VADWLSEYPTASTRRTYAALLTKAMTATGATTATELEPGRIAAWLEDAGYANNTVRAHLTAIRTYLKWCVETGRITSYRDTPYRRLLKSYPATYGKVSRPGFGAVLVPWPVERHTG
jgi:site-specific recombinase XerD